MNYRVRFRGAVDLERGDVVAELGSQGQEREVLVDCDHGPLEIRGDGPVHIRVDPVEEDPDRRHCPSCGSFVDADRAGQECVDCADQEGEDDGD